MSGKNSPPTFNGQFSKNGQLGNDWKIGIGQKAFVIDFSEGNGLFDNSSEIG